MNKTTQYYDLASLAEASYIQFDKFVYSNSKLVEAALINKKLEGNFSPTQASNFVDKWKVVDHQPNTESGFSATLFESKENPGEYVYAIRGTEVGLRDLLMTDIYDLVYDGLAIDQIVDMYNDWQRMNAPDGAVYKAAEFELLIAESFSLRWEHAYSTTPNTPGLYEQYLKTRDDIIIEMPSRLVYRINTNIDSDELFSDDRAYGSGKITGGEDVVAVGHSLGGHLATAFSRLFPDRCDDALTVNGAGFPTGATGGVSGNAETNIRNLFSMLGGADHFNSSEILNLYGDKGILVTTMNEKYGLLQQGGHQEIYIESYSFGNVGGHGACQMTDSLAVYNLFAQLDIDKYITYEFKRFFDELNPVFNTMERGGRSNLDTYENIVYAFGDALVNGYQHIARSQWQINREGLYKAINSILVDDEQRTRHADITTLTEMSASEIESQAKAGNECGIAFRYSLVNLIPFATTGEQVCYDNLNIGGKLDIHTSENTDGELTEHYIEDRSMFLYHLMNPEATLSGGSGNIFL